MMRPEKRIQTEQLPADFELQTIYLIFGGTVIELRTEGDIVGWMHRDSLEEQMHEAGLDDHGVASCMAVIQDAVNHIDPWVRDDSSLVETITMDI